MDNLQQYLQHSPMATQMQEMMAPLMKLTPAGKEKELFKLTVDLQEKSTDYWKKATELQHIVYQAAQHAMEKVMENILKKIQKGDGPGTFNDFFNNWVNATEDALTTSFSDKTFSKLQGDLLASGLEIKKIVSRQIEESMSSLPVVPRSEVDELYKTIHDMKTRMRVLEKQLKNKGNQSDTPELVTATESASMAEVKPAAKKAAPRKKAAATK